MQILDRLSGRLDLLKGGRDADPRQQTLRATIEWSYELLTPEEKHPFATLAVFAGGCTLVAAEEVADADLDTLQSLVDKSLLRHTDERFWMLETIREYAAERLAASGEAPELQRRHADHFLAVAEEAEPHLFQRNPQEWIEQLERDQDNFRAALDRFEASADTQHVLRLAGALAQFWGVKAHFTEGRRRFEASLNADERPTAARARALIGAADLANGSGDHSTSRLRAEEALALNRALGQPWGTASALLVLGIALANERDFAPAQQLVDESMRLYRELGDETNTLEATRILAWTYSGLGDRDRARELHEDNVRRARAVGDRFHEAVSLTALATYAITDGRREDALPMLREAYRLDRELGDPYRVAITVSTFAHLLAAGGRAGPAARVLSSAEALFAEIGAGPAWIKSENEEALATIRQQLDEAAFDIAWEQGRSLTADEAVALALEALD
jgi:tetratricopeptide (TPR) repeat protein